jgi:hypothetical protein
MKKILNLLLSVTAASLLFSCGEKPVEVVKNDTLKENPLMQGLSEEEQEELRKIIADIPVPFSLLNQVAESGLPFHKEFLNPETNVGNYNTAEAKAINIGIYGSDIAYIIAFERLSESGAYLKSIRQLTDEVVIPTAFDDAAMKRYEMHAANQDSMQSLIYDSYVRIDSSLQNNERFALATLVVTSGWVESLYLTTQQIGNQQRSESNKLLFDILADQQEHTDEIAAMLSMFPQDSLMISLADDVKALQLKSSPVNEYTVEELTQVTAHIAAMRNKLITIH